MPPLLRLRRNLDVARCASRDRRSSILNLKKKKEDNPRIPKDSGARKVSSYGPG